MQSLSFSFVIPTLMGYLHQAVQCHTYCQLLSPHTRVPIDYISLMMDAVWKYEQVPDWCKMIHDPMLVEIISGSQAAPPDSHTAALCDWIFLGGYNGFHKSKWCNNHHTKFACIEDPLLLGPDSISFIDQDFSFFSPMGIQLTNIPNLTWDQAHCS